MNADVLGVVHHPLGPDYGLGALRPRSVRRAYARALLHRSNPRTAEYMQQRFLERWPEGKVVDPPDAERAAREAKLVVLLYPDAIGLGFSRVERKLSRAAAGAAPIRALNGRSRDLVLDRRTLIALRVRRLLERSMIGDAALLAVLLLAAPPLWLFDRMRGRR